MNKKLFLSIISACILAMGISASAATVNSVVVSDFDKSLVTVTGTLTAGETGTDIYVEKYADPRVEIADGKNYANQPGFQNIIVQPATVTEAEDGTKTFEAVFKFNAPGAEGGVAGVMYDVYAANSAQPFKFLFIDKESVYNFVDLLAAGNVPKETMYAELVKFGPSIGADPSFAATKQSYLAQNMIDYKERIQLAQPVEGESVRTARVNKARDIMDLTKAELEFMAALPNAMVASTVNSLIETYDAPAEIDTTTYLAMTDAQKMKVCNQFIQDVYTDMKNFRIDFNKAVTSATGGQPGVPQFGQLGGTDIGGNGGTSPTPVSPGGVNTSGSALLNQYRDVAQAEWAVEAIEYVVKNGIMQGTSANTFEPNEEVTREQVAKIISIAFNSYNPNATSPFGDVAGGHWSAAYIGSAYASGLLTGKSATEFGLGEKMSREDLCTVMYRAATKMGYSFGTENADFADFGKVNAYAQEAVKKLAGAKIISGMGDGVLAPKGTATRAQTAQMLMKLANLIK